jgi:predicted MFS family arabinose efflux permease
MVAAFLLVPESKNPNPGKIDYLGVLASVAGLTLLVFGIVRGGDTSNWGSTQVLGSIIGGLVILGLFAWYEARIAHPSLDVRLFKDRRLSASVGAITLLFFGMGGVFFFTSYYLQNVRGYSPLEAGLLYVPFAVGQMIASPRSAGLVRRFGPKAVGASGMLLTSIAMGGYALLSTTSPIWVLAVLYVIQGAGAGVAMPAATSAVMEVLPRERAGAGSALTNTARQVAVALSVAALGSVLAEIYRSKMSPVLPASVRGTAESSITATQAVAAQLGKAGHALLAPANTAYVDAMHVTTLAATVISLLGVVVMLRWMPGKPAQAEATDTLEEEAELFAETAGVEG